MPEFLDRAGHSFQNWPDLLENWHWHWNWHGKVRASIGALEALEFEKLPETVLADCVKDGLGLDNTTCLTEAHDPAIQLPYRTWQYHFEFLNLGYAAYLVLFGFMKEQFPSIPDQADAKVVQGHDSDLFRPDGALRKLARLAIEVGVADALKAGTVDEALARGPERGEEPVVQPHHRQRLPLDRQVPDRASRHPDGVPARRHRPCRGGRDDRTPDRGAPRRARPDHR